MLSGVNAVMGRRKPLRLQARMRAMPPRSTRGYGSASAVWLQTGKSECSAPGMIFPLTPATACERTQALQVLAAVTPEEVARFDGLLQDEHYLQAGQPVGDFLRQVVVCEGQWVGLLAWGACSYALQARAKWIGWNAPLRAARQKLLVQNRRFLIPGKARQPKPSRILSCSRALATAPPVGFQWV